MDRTPVSSSTIQAIGYDPASNTLEVEFKSGTVYQYAGVPQAEFDSLMNASSHGIYFNANIKNSYLCVKL